MDIQGKPDKIKIKNDWDVMSKNAMVVRMFTGNRQVNKCVAYNIILSNHTG